MTAHPTRRPRAQTVRASTVTLAAAADVLAVLVFAAVGRGSHAEMVDGFGLLITAVPFLLGLLAGWLVARAWHAPWRCCCSAGEPWQT